MILTAAEWGRTLHGTLQPLRQPATYWIIHHTAGSSARALRDELRAVNADALEEGKVCIDYSFAVTKAGEIGEGRGWGIHGAHTGATVAAGLPRAGESYNEAGHALVFVGDYHTPGRDTPTPVQLEAAAWLLAEGVRLGHVAPDFRTVGHRDTKPTACPGDRLYPLIGSIHSAAHSLLLPVPEEDDLPFSEADLRRIISEEVDKAILRRLGPVADGAKQTIHETARQAIRVTKPKA